MDLHEFEGAALEVHVEAASEALGVTVQVVNAPASLVIVDAPDAVRLL